MGIIRRTSDRVDLWVPGVREVKKKDKVEVKRSSPIDDLFESGELVLGEEYCGMVIDTFSKAGRAIIRYIANQDLSDNKKTQRVRVKTTTGRTITNPMKPDYGLFGSTIEEWLALITPAVATGKIIVLVGHERLAVTTDDDEKYVDAFGCLEVPGQTVHRGLPGAIMTLLRMGKKKAGKGRVARIVRSEDPSPVWHAKDRLRVFPPKGVDIEVEWEEEPETFEEIEEFKWDVCMESAKVWEKWVDIAMKKGLSGMVGVYGPPGVGKTSFVAGLVYALTEKTGKPMLYCDWDSEGAASLPEKLFEEGE